MQDLKVQKRRIYDITNVLEGINLIFNELVQVLGLVKHAVGDDLDGDSLVGLDVLAEVDLAVRACTDRFSEDVVFDLFFHVQRFLNQI